MSKMRQETVIKKWQPEWDARIQEIAKTNRNVEYITDDINDDIDDHNRVSLPGYTHVTKCDVYKKMKALGIEPQGYSIVVQFKKTGS